MTAEGSVGSTTCLQEKGKKTLFGLSKSIYQSPFGSIILLLHSWQTGLADDNPTIFYHFCCDRCQISKERHTRKLKSIVSSCVEI
jgi:hypothetical protein